MAFFQMSVLLDNNEHTAICFEITQHKAEELVTTLKRQRDLHPFELLSQLCNVIKYIGDARVLTGEEMLVLAGAVAQGEKPKTKRQPVKLKGNTLMKAAEAGHEANREYCISIGDTSQVPWAEAAMWQKESAISGVTFAVEHDFPSPEKMHENWMAEKLKAGWVYGEVKDPDAKPPKHPCLVPYAELPEAQRKKDEIFRTAIMKALGVHDDGEG